MHIVFIHVCSIAVLQSADCILAGQLPWQLCSKACFTLSIYAVQWRKTWYRCVTHSSSRNGKWLSHYVLFVKIILPFGMVGLNYGHPHNMFREEPFSCPFVICKTNSSSRGAIWTILTPMLLFRNKTGIENLKPWVVVLLNMSCDNNTHEACTNYPQRQLPEADTRFIHRCLGETRKLWTWNTWFFLIASLENDM